MTDREQRIVSARIKDYDVVVLKKTTGSRPGWPRSAYAARARPRAKPSSNSARYRAAGPPGGLTGVEPYRSGCRPNSCRKSSTIPSAE